MRHGPPPRGGTCNTQSALVPPAIRLIYFDNAATSQKPRAVIDALVRHYERDNANVYRGLHALSNRATDAYEGARAKVAGFLGASSPQEIIFTRGVTEAVNLVAQV